MPICRKVIVIYPQFLNSTKKIAKEGKAVSNSSLPIEIWARVWCQRRWRNKNKVTAAAVAAMGKAIKFPGISEGVQKLLDVDIDSTSQQPLYFPLPPPSPLSNFQTYNDGFSLNNKVITLSITGALNAVLSKEHKLEICRYLYNHQNRDDGWGLHIEGPSTMFGTILNYVTLRLLGEGTNDGQGAMKKGRQWILDHGSATAITSWGKMWLSVLGVFEWSGNNPLPPETWLLPYILPIHPVVTKN